MSDERFSPRWGQTQMKNIVVVGGGLAGMAAAEQAARLGARVTLLEWRQVLGGRAAAYTIKFPNEVHTENCAAIDNGQHLVLGCCTEALAFFERLGVKTCFTRREGILFASAADFSKNSARRWKFSASPLLPTKLQFAPAFFKNPFLSFGDRVRIALVARRLGGRRSLSPNDISFAAWAEAQRLSKKSLAVFWQPFILSALCETLENVSIAAVQKVVRQGLFGGRDALAMYIPNRSLREIFNERAGDALRTRGVEIIFGERVESFTADENGITLRARSGNAWNADAVVFAVPPSALWEVMHNAQVAEEVMSGFGFDEFESAAITTIHLWATRRILPAGEDVCTLLGDFRNDFHDGGQMIFVPPRENGLSENNDAGILHTVVISAAHRLLNEEELASSGHEKLIARITEQLRQTFPEAFADSASPILHAKATTVLDAVQSPQVKKPRENRDGEEKIPRVAFAGDWRCEDFPNTFESAVRSGIRAVESLDFQ